MNRLRLRRAFDARKHRKGAVVVEFAITAPVFFVFLIAAFEFGRLNVIRHTADNAAYEAARHAIVPGATAAEAIDKANTLMNVVGARGVNVTVTPADLNEDVDFVKVVVDVPMASNGWIVPKFTSASTMHGESTMKTERSGN